MYLCAASAVGSARGEALVEVQPKPTEADIAERARGLYLEGESNMRAKQYADGLELLRKAGDLGEVRAMLALGDLYGQEAEGHTGDDEESARWYRKAAEAGDVLGMLDLGGVRTGHRRFPERCVGGAMVPQGGQSRQPFGDL
jgi:TPR repeat protein